MERGLPEIVLIELIGKKGPLRIEEINIESKNIAISWAKKNGWINIEQGVLKLTPKGAEIIETRAYALQSALEKIDREGTCEEEFLKVLESRNLIERVKEIPDIEEIAQLTPEIIISGIWKTKPFKPYDVYAPAPQVYPGKKHPYAQFIEEVKEKLIEMGFEEVESPLVETEFWNFDALFVPQDHPAREWHDIFFLKNPKTGKIPENLKEKIKLTHENGWITGSKGWGIWSQERALRLILRSHTTTASVRYLSKFDGEETKVFSIGRIFRPDVIDRTHLMEFDQCEGIIVGKKVTFRHLLGMLKEFAKVVLGTEKIKFIPHYYPFTEPSVDMAVYFPKLKKWVEIVGSGMFRPEVLKPLGIDYPVLAWGFGFSRLAMFKLEIDDIRYLFTRDIKFLREYPVMKCLL